MADDAIKIPVQVDADAAVAALVALGRHVLAAGQATEDAGKKAEASGIGWDRLAGGLNSAWELAGRVRGQIVALVDSITELSAEQSRLDANSARLSLDFDAAAAAAGKFADETEAMTAATRMAETGVRLTQTELNALMRTAGAFAQNTGTSVTDAVNTLTSALISGSTRGLRQFGTDLAEVAGGSHTAGERLRALVTHAEHTTQATDNAADATARLRDSLDDMKRVAAHAFTQTIVDLAQMDVGLRRGATDADEMAIKTRAIGQAAAYTAMQMLNVFGVVGGGFAAGIGLLGRAVMAVSLLVSGNLTGARAQIAALSDPESLFRQAGGFTADRIQSMMRMGGEPGVSAETRAAPAPISARGPRRSDMTVTEAERDASAEDIEARTRRPGGAGGGTSDRIPSWGEQERAKMALEEGLIVTAENAIAQRQATRDATRREQERTAFETWFQDQMRASQAQAAANKAREAEIQNAAQAEQRRGSVGGNFRRQFGEFGTMSAEAQEAAGVLHKLPSLAESAALRVRGAFDSMSEAFGNYIFDLAEGRATLAEALEGMAIDTIRAIGKMASQEAGMEFARAIASAAIGNFGGAGLHVAAGTAYLAVAGVAGATAVAITPTKPEKTRGEGAAARSAAPVSPQSQAATGGGQVINISFGTVIGAGGVRQAAREIADVLNRGAIQGGAVLNQRVVQNAA